jgi:hypothetical protein
MVHFISDFSNLSRKYLLAVNISHGYQISINSQEIEISLNTLFSINKFIASVISYSHLIDNLKFSTNLKISDENLYTHILARFHMFFVGFSIIFVAYQFLSSKIPYFEGSFTSFTRAQ